MAFADEATAEATAKSRVADGTYTEAHNERETDGTIAIRALMPVTSSNGGGWVEVTS